MTENIAPFPDQTALARLPRPQRRVKQPEIPEAYVRVGQAPLIFPSRQAETISRSESPGLRRLRSGCLHSLLWNTCPPESLADSAQLWWFHGLRLRRNRKARPAAVDRTRPAPV